MERTEQYRKYETDQKATVAICQVCTPADSSKCRFVDVAGYCRGLQRAVDVNAAEGCRVVDSWRGLERIEKGTFFLWRLHLDRPGQKDGVYPGRPGQDVCRGLGLRCMQPSVPHATRTCTT